MDELNGSLLSQNLWARLTCIQQCITKILIVLPIFFVISCASTPAQLDKWEVADKATRKVAGTLSLIFAPTVLATAPQPPIHIKLMVKSELNGLVQFHEVNDTAPVWIHSHDNPAASLQNFLLTLEPGKYQITGMELDSDSLSSNPVIVPFPIPLVLNVKEEQECAYVGQIVHSFLRLPAGTVEQAQNVVKLMANQMSRPFGLVYLSKGALVPLQFFNNVPESDESNNSDEKSAYSFYQRAIDHGCQKQLLGI